MSLYEYKKEVASHYEIAKGHTEITFEQFQKHVLKENSAKEKQTKMRKIKSSQAQDIIDIACNTWKANLAEKWAKEIVLQKEIEITEDFYQEMRKACTKEQNELFDKIFGIESPYKEGELILIKHNINGTWDLRYFSHIENGKVGTFNSQKKNGAVTFWDYHAPAKGVTLPE